MNRTDNQASAAAVFNAPTLNDLYVLTGDEDALASETVNARSISLAAAALREFAGRTGLDAAGEPAETAFVDLLANLMLLCEYCYPHDCGTSFDSLLDTARMHFSAESDSENSHL